MISSERKLSVFSFVFCVCRTARVLRMARPLPAYVDLYLVAARQVLHILPATSRPVWSHATIAN